VLTHIAVWTAQTCRACWLLCERARNAQTAVLLEITNNMRWFVQLLYSMYWFLHVSAVACHHQGASQILLSYVKYKPNGRYIIKCVVTWPVCRNVVSCICTQLGSTTDGTTTFRHTGHATTHYTLWYTTHSICILSNSEGYKKLADDGRLLPKYVGAST
jgi:hypothetical protein